MIATSSGSFERATADAAIPVRTAIASPSPSPTAARAAAHRRAYQPIGRPADGRARPISPIPTSPTADEGQGEEQPAEIDRRGAARRRPAS